jgi:hypothetical protein
MIILEFTSPNTGYPISIPVRTITGLATGADGADGGENGWYVQESYDRVQDLIAGVEL